MVGKAQLGKACLQCRQDIVLIGALGMVAPVGLSRWLQS